MAPIVIVKNESQRRLPYLKKPRAGCCWVPTPSSGVGHNSGNARKLAKLIDDYVSFHMYFAAIEAIAARPKPTTIPTTSLAAIFAVSTTPIPTVPPTTVDEILEEMKKKDYHIVEWDDDLEEEDEEDGKWKMVDDKEKWIEMIQPRLDKANKHQNLFPPPAAAANVASIPLPAAAVVDGEEEEETTKPAAVQEGTEDTDTPDDGVVKDTDVVANEDTPDDVEVADTPDDVGVADEEEDYHDTANVTKPAATTDTPDNVDVANEEEDYDDTANVTKPAATTDTPDDVDVADKEEDYDDTANVTKPAATTDVLKPAAVQEEDTDMDAHNDKGSDDDDNHDDHEDFDDNNSDDDEDEDEPPTTPLMAPTMYLPITPTPTPTLDELKEMVESRVGKVPKKKHRQGC